MHMTYLSKVREVFLREVYTIAVEYNVLKVLSIVLAGANAYLANGLGTTYFRSDAHSTEVTSNIMHTPHA